MWCCTDDAFVISLDRGAHGIALGQATRHGVVRGDVVEIAAAAEDRRDESLLLGPGDHIVHILLDLGVRFEITVDNVLGLLRGISSRWLRPKAEMP